MKNLTLSKIAEVCGGKLVGEADDREVSSIVTDNRKVEKDSLFVAIKGARVDGHDFVKSCFENGAMGVVVEKDVETKPYILVENSLVAIKKIAEYYRSILNIKVVGVTGSVGKTSTKEMIHSVLSQKFDTLKTEGNFNNELGLPLTVFRLRENHQIAVLEMGISDFGEMTRLTQIAKPDVSVITNIGYCHLENLKTRDGILQAKTEMFKSLNPEGAIILNGDDDKLSTIKEYNGIKPVFFKAEGGRDTGVFASDIESSGIKGTKCKLHYNDDVIEVFINIPGRHMVSNALAAMCVGKTFGLSNDEIKKGIEELKPVSGRNNIIETEEYTIIDDCYNANPVSMKAGIDVLSYAEGRKVAVLGDMFELGANENMLHKEIGTYLCSSNIDVVIFCGKLMNNAYNVMQAPENAERIEDKKIYYFERLEDLMTEITRIVKEDDTVLVKASHGMNFVQLINKLK